MGILKSILPYTMLWWHFSKSDISIPELLIKCVWRGMPKITSLLFLCNILRKKWMMKLICCMQVSMKVSCKFILGLLMGMFKHSQSFRNSKSAMSLQYLKKEVRDEVDFLHAEKGQIFLQVDFNTLSIKVSYGINMGLIKFNKGILSLLMGMNEHS